MSSATRVGWLGGTFDPIHCGHLDVARAAQTALQLDEVHLAPAGTPPHRPAPFASPADRWAMVELACGEHDWLSASDVELTQGGPSYTIDTVRHLEAKGLSHNALHLIVGADAFAHIMSWKEGSALVDCCHFVVVSRPGAPAPALRQTLPTLAPRMVDAAECREASTPSIFLVDAPTAPVSSTDVRSRAAAGQSLEGWVPPTIADYIDSHGLYRGEA